MNSDHYAHMILSHVINVNDALTGMSGFASGYLDKLRGHMAHPESMTIIDLNTAKLTLRSLADAIEERANELTAKHNQLETA